MKRANIKRMLRETHPDYEMSTEITEAMFIQVSDSAVNRIKEKGLSKIRNQEVRDNVNENFIHADIYRNKRRIRIWPVATAACLIVGFTAIPLIMSRNSSDKLTSDNDILTPAYTDMAEDNSETEPDCELVEVKTFSEYKSLGGISYAAGALNIGMESDHYNFAMLAYKESGADDNTYLEFITSSDIPDKYIQKAGCNVTCGITDFYVTDEGDIYYCGWLKPLKSDTKDGYIGKYNQKSGKTEFLKVFDEMLFGMIMVTDSGEIIVSGDNGAYYQLDNKAENIMRMEEEPDISDWPGAFIIDSASPYFSQYGHDFNGRSYQLLDFMTHSCSKLCRMDLNTGKSKIFYSTEGFDVSRNGNIYSTYSFYNDERYADVHLTAYNNYSIPSLLGTENIGEGHLSCCDVNLITSFFDYEQEKSRYSVYSPDGEKLYDFDLPDTHINWLGNISSESGEKIFYIARDKNKVLCYEPETDQTGELTTLNEKFDYSDDDLNIFMTKSDKYDFLIWNQKHLYGYSINSDELTLITESLDYYGMQIIRITADDKGNIYFVANGSNVLYSIVPKKNTAEVIDFSSGSVESVSE